MKQNTKKMNAEELKTIAGSIMYDLRADWSKKFRVRVNKLIKNLNELSSLISKEEQVNINELINLAKESISDKRSDEMKQKTSYGNYYGSVFRNKYLYAYASPSGATDSVKQYLKTNLLHPDTAIQDNWKHFSK